MAYIGKEEIQAILKEITDRGDDNTVDYLREKGIDVIALFEICLQLEEKEYLKGGARVMAGVLVGMEVGRRIEFEERMKV